MLDYGVPSRNRPSLLKVSYAELKSGKVVLKDKTVPSSPLSSFKVAREIAETLKRWIQEGTFLLSQPSELLPKEREFKPLEVREYEHRVRDVMRRQVITAKATDDVKTAAELLVKHGADHLPIVNEKNQPIGIVTSWDIAKAVAKGSLELSQIMTRKVITALESEAIDVVAHRLTQHNISGAPVVDGKNHLVGIVTTDDLATLLKERR